MWLPGLSAAPIDWSCLLQVGCWPPDLLLPFQPGDNAFAPCSPDLIFISAGFDAHRKDDINFRYIGIQEKDYEWLTDQIVQVWACSARQNARFTELDWPVQLLGAWLTCCAGWAVNGCVACCRGHCMLQWALYAA